MTKTNLPLLTYYDLPPLTEEEKKLLRQEWRTPDDFYSVIDGEFEFTVDVAADGYNSRCPIWIDKDDDALRENINWFGPWKGRVQAHSAFCNPGFADLLPWMKKAFAETQRFQDSVACVMGIPSVASDWWDFAQAYAHEIRCLSPRVQYVSPDPRISQSTNARDCVMVVFRKVPQGAEWPGAKIWTWDWKETAKCLATDPAT